LALQQGEIDGKVGRLSRLGRQRDFSLSRFCKALALAAGQDDQREILRQLLTDWTGLPHGGREAEERWREVEKTYAALREALGGPVSLQTALLHHYHTRKGLLKEPRLLSDQDLAVLRVNAITDPLTGLYNRRFLLDHLGREIARAERTHGIVSVLLTDLKDFKGVNDHFGHPVGDTVLVRTARVIREMLRVVDAGCRFGGDEFVVVLPNTDMYSAFAVAERIRKRVSASALPGRAGFSLGMHYGIATYPADGRTADFLLKIADLRLYQCREQSSFRSDRRRHPRFFPSDMNLHVFPGRTGGAWTASVLDVGYGGVAFRGRAASRLSSRWNAEITQQEDPERHPVKLRVSNSINLPGGGLRIGCSYT
jgi:diguanylate cyclase (GGDEF)-like protein